MTWATPKTDWDTDDAVGTADFNRIEENTRIAGLNLGHGNAIESVASANSLDITATTDIFYITGVTAVHYIKTIGRAAGAKIYLVFQSSLSIKNNQGSAGAGYAKILTIGDITTQTDEVKVFIFDGTQWRWVTDNT